MMHDAGALKPLKDFFVYCVSFYQRGKKSKILANRGSDRQAPRFKDTFNTSPTTWKNVLVVLTRCIILMRNEITTTPLTRDTNIKHHAEKRI